MNVSKRIEAMQYSPIRKLVPFAEAAKKQGKTVYHLNIGQPDIETPREFFDAVKNFDEKVLEYAFSQGIPQLIDSFIEYYKLFGVTYGKDEILVTNGGSEALFFALVAVCDYGDEVIVPEPFYTNYNSFSKSAGAVVVPVATQASDGFKLPPIDAIEGKINSKTRAIMLSNPGNPTGAVYDIEDMNKVKALALKHNLYIIADEVYKEMVYDGLKFTSFSQMEGIEDRVIITDSISKRYSACGARIGCVASKNKEVMKQILKLCQGRLCVATIEQVGAAALSAVSPQYMADVIKEYESRRNIVFEALKRIDGVVCEKPHGAFYIMAKLPVADADDFAKWLLTDFSVDNATVMVAPGAGFYATEGLGKDEIRISYVLKEDKLKAAMNILAEALKAYQG
ncbi:MAG: pyridoxal phosphate-dependent aminotransferase [Defluviitaleaceae bacterium]|nr:pyridoxal phosphate-dependent aminotransferase [Defluviitaleaceae bacterium]MCL2836158.1 pyridoxal phosphate-dependent aminotransferase [Defluviitaleaceae bacterium]